MVVSITAFRDIAAGETLLNTVSGIDATATATTNLYTVPGGQTVVVTKVVLRVTAIDTLTVDPVGGVGIAAGEQDIFFPQTITGLTAIGDTWTFDAAAQAVDASAAEIIKLGLDTLATATTLTLAADIFGYFVGSAPVQLASAATAAVVTNSAPGPPHCAIERSLPI
jgi:CDP-diglyceride synthetase